MSSHVYIWESEEAAKAFFTDELLERVTKLYVVRPVVEFVEVAALVENIRATWRSSSVPIQT